MKINISRAFPFLLLILMFSIFCIATAFNDRSPRTGNAVSRVDKSELPAETHNEEIAQILVQRMIKKYSIGTRGWTEWIWSYQIEEIHLDDAGFEHGINVVILVKPLIPAFWADVWTFEVDRVENGWVRVGYMMVVDDKGEFYELRGPFTGG